MKPTFSVLLIAIIGVIAISFSNCKKDSKSSYTCVDANTACGVIKCCTNSVGTGYYEVKGVKYNFTSTTISEAANEAAAAACSKGTSADIMETQLQLEDYLSIAIEEAKLE